MGGKGYVAKYKNKNLTPKQRSRLGIPENASDITVTRIGGITKITYKEIVNGVIIVRTKWIEKKTKEKRKHT